MPWKFVPTQRSVKLHPGQSTLAFYTAENKADTSITGGWGGCWEAGGRAQQWAPARRPWLAPACQASCLAALPPTAADHF